MTSKETDKTISNVFNYLDKLDLMSYIKACNNDDIHDLMNCLEQKFPFNDGYSVTLFDTIAEDEFVEYLNKRYDLDIKETIISNYYIRL